MKSMAIALAGAVLALAPCASAQVRGWLNFGSTAPGESTDPGHENWIPVLSFTSEHDANGFQLCARKEVDKSGPLLMKACAVGSHFPTVLLDVQKTVAGSPTTFWQLVLTDVVITSYTSTGDSPESIDSPPRLIQDEVCMTWKSLKFSVRTFPPSGSSYVVSKIISPDNDGDSLPDAYEELYGLDPKVSNLRADTDGDGVPDIEEYRLGTNPNDATSFFQVVGTMGNPETGILNLTWPSVSGDDYTIEYSPDLVTGFTPLTTLTAIGPETTHTVPRILATGFFRVSRPTP